MKNRWLGTTAGVALVLLLGGSQFATADTTTPTRAEALAAVKHAQSDLDTARAYLEAEPTPSATATTDTPTPSPTPPVSANLSGLTWNSGVWSKHDLGMAASFVSGPRGGKLLDNVLVYTSRDNMGVQNRPQDWRGAIPAYMLGSDNKMKARADLVLGLTSWTSDGAYMTQAQGQSIGSSACTIDETPIVRLDWEMNLPDGAGYNGAMLTASNYTAWVTRFRSVATGLKTGCPGLRIDFNPNHGADQTSGCATWPIQTQCSRRAFQALKDVINIYGVDTYDTWPPVTASGSGWNSRMTGANELQDALNYAKANGKKFSVPEWGVWCRNTSGCAFDSNQSQHTGGDDPEYMRRMVGFFRSNAGDMSYETYFNEDATYINSDLIVSNPNSRAAYRTALVG